MTWLVFALALLIIGWFIFAGVTTIDEDTAAAQHEASLDELWRD